MDLRPSSLPALVLLVATALTACQRTSGAQALDDRAAGNSGSLRVHVVDASSGSGIPGAQVIAVYAESEPGPSGREEQTVRVTTDEGGVTYLPPLTAGTLSFQVRAAGYEIHPPVTKAAAQFGNVSPSELRIQLPARVATLQLRLPDGSPAAGAFAAVTEDPSITIGRPQARADDQGEVKLPCNLTGFVMVRHPDAAFLVRPWPPEEDEPTLRWTLTPAAPPLTIWVRDDAGGDFTPQARVALWVDGVRLSDQALMWLAGTIPMVGGDGSWTGNNLPMEPVSIAAWAGRIPDEQSGERARPGTRVSYPWPERVEIRTVD